MNIQLKESEKATQFWGKEGSERKDEVKHHYKRVLEGVGLVNLRTGSHLNKCR